MTTTRRVYFAIFLVTCCALLPGAAAETALTQSDEYRVSMATVLEMGRDGHFWIPHLDGSPRLQKPPLLYWLLFLATTVLGPSVLAMRLPVILFAAGSACLTESLARRSGIDGAPPGSAGLLMAASLGVGVLGRVALLEIPLLFFILLAVVCWLRFEERGVGAWAVVAGVALGLSALVKGPIGPLVGGVAIAGRVWLCASPKVLVGHGRSLALAAAGFALTAGAWPVAMFAEYGQTFSEIVGNEVFGKRFGRDGSGGALSVAGGLLLLTAPWTLLFLVALPRLARRGSPREGRWLLLWCFAALLPFVFARSGFERYALPALPPATLLALHTITTIRNRSVKIAAAITAGTFVLAGVSLLWLFAHFGVAQSWAIAGAAAGLGMFGFGVLREGRLRLAASGFLLFQTIFFGSMYPELGINRLPADLATKIGSRPVVLYGSRPPAMLAMTLGRPVPGIRVRTESMRALAESGGWIAVSGESRRELENRLRRLGYRWRVIREWHSLHTRKTALRVFRDDAEEADLRHALATGSFEGLKERFAILGDFEAPSS